MVALASAPRGWPENSQFFLLCRVPHKRNYVELSIMRNKPTAPNDLLMNAANNKRISSFSFGASATRIPHNYNESRKASTSFDGLNRTLQDLGSFILSRAHFFISRFACI